MLRTVTRAFVLSATLANSLSAQDTTTLDATRFVNESWTVENGLPVNAIQRVLRDHDGYLWLATWDGLVRFDGVRFTIFNTGNTEALPSNRIADMLTDGRGSLWMRTEQDHLVRVRDGQFTNFDSSTGLPTRSTRSVFVNSAGVVLVGTANGAYRLANDRFEPVATGVITGEVTALLHRAAGEVWAGTRSGSLSVVANGTAHTVSLPGNPTGGRGVTVLRADGADGVWIGTSSGLYRWRAGISAAVPLASGAAFGQSVSDIRPGANGQVWVASTSGVFALRDGALHPVHETPGRASDPGVRFHPDGGAWYAVGDRLYHEGRSVFQVPLRDSVDTRSIKQIQDFGWDAEGSLWIGTYNNGLYRLKPSVFQVYSAREGVAERNVSSVLEDRDGAVWIGTLGRGLSRLSAGTITSFTPASGYPPFVLSLMQAVDGTLWVGTLQQGVIQCRLPAMSCTAAAKVEGLSGATVRALHQDPTGSIWMGAEDGLFVRRGGRWQRVDGDSASTSGPVRSFLQAPDGTLFMATNGSGVLAFRAGRLSRITTAQGLPSDLIRSLHLDARGSLWVGTEGRGLVRLSTAVGAGGDVIATAVRTIRQRDGLFDEVIHQILPDAFGRLWMSTNRGIFWTNLADLDAFADGRSTRIHSTSFTERDGLRNREANGGQSPAGIVGRDGRLWFATQDGAVVVDPSRTRSNRVPPPVRVERLVTGKRTLHAGDEIALAPDERDFQVEYTALSLLAPENVQFRYRLEGFTDAWTDAGNRRTAFYTNVPPGTYTFRVVASNNDGVWNDVGGALSLRVAPQFHETPAAWLLLALTVGLLAAAGVRWRLEQLRKRGLELTALVSSRTAELERNQRQLAATNGELAELTEARSKLFANLSHEFRTPLTLIIGPLNALLEGRYGSLSAAVRAQSELMMRNAGRLLRLINRILDLSRAEQGGLILDAQPQELVAFARDLVQGFAPLAEQRALNLRFESDVPALTVPFDAELLEEVLLNLLSNALKFTEAGGSIVVAIHETERHAVMSVQDTGVGVPEEELSRLFERFYQGPVSLIQEQGGSGIGLSLARELVTLHGGTISARSIRGEGSLFTVELPLMANDDHRPASPRVDAVTPASADLPVSDMPRPQAHADDQTTVLVVDDHEEIRAYLRSILAPRYRVLDASDGRAALALCTAELPDLVITDVMMPDMDGLAFSRALKADVMTEAIPVVMLSARAAAPDQIAGFETGADAYLVKPFDGGVLQACVHNLLEQRARLLHRMRRGEIAPPRAAAEPTCALDARLRPLVQANVHDSGFGADQLAAAASLSYHQLYRKLRDELGSTPSRYIRGVRAECAAELLRTGAGTVTQVAYAVGFESLSYFRRAFRERYGTSPSDYLETSSSVAPPH